MRRSHAEVDEWQTQMQLKPMSKGRIFLVSDRLPAECEQLTGVTCVRSIDRAIRESLARHGENALAVIPEGPYVVPFYRPHKIE
jgi:hypothetical protein